MCLEEIIIDKIQSTGPLPFRDFMEMCLYYPGQGYYTSGKEKMGKNGDYYTSPFITPLFGQSIARQLEEMWERMGKRSFVVAEYGAGTGLLCRDILEALRKNKSFFKKLSYVIIEKNPSPLPENEWAENVRCCHDMNELEGMEGCVLSNELVDNFPVHRVVMQKELMEIWVDHREGRFVEVTRPAGPNLINYFEELGIELPEGYQTEINWEATQWIKDIARRLKKGFVLTMDYGFPSHELYHSARRSGNLVCYHQHRLNTYPYHHIGLQDITTHVNFSALHHWGSRNGLDFAGYTSQAYFLMGLGIGHAQHSAAVSSPGLLKTLLMDLGSKIKVLIQQKNIPPVMLSGMRLTQRLV